MALRAFKEWQQRPATSGALLVACAGLLAWLLSGGGALERWSFDLPTLLNSARGFPELVLIELDEPSHEQLKQDRGKPWDRRLHANLVDHLRADGARTIVFDAEFYEQGDDPAATAKLADAFRAHGRVVLAAALVHIGKAGFGGTTVRRPLPELLVPGVSWGVSWNIPALRGEEDGVVRFHPVGRDPDPSLPWVAARLDGAAVTTNAPHDAERWVRHYGPARTLPRLSYWQATNEVPGFYRGKTVFIGGRPGTGFVGQETDQFRTPWGTVSGLELTATAWLNLMRHDWLNRAAPWTELIALGAFTALLGVAVLRGPMRRGLLLAGLAAALVPALAVWLFCFQRVWCAWTVAWLVQIPVAAGWRFITNYRALQGEKEWLDAPLGDLFGEPAPASNPAPNESPTPAATSAAAGAPNVPDYELLRCVGRGAYGEVWLARDVLGGFRAVKIVRRVAFDDDGPYEREFRGLQKFAPVSREHPGLVQVLHVGLNRPAGFFYYVMEAGDDETSAQKITPEHYTPRNLGRDLRRRGRCAATETTRLGLALCDALAFLHGRGLIHRDIKPANVIFVAGAPKLADVGLVTDTQGGAFGVTQVGTEGYIPPEGTGTEAADVFALGRLLEETLEETPATGDDGNAAAVAALREIIARAHAAEPAARLPSARALGDALRDWQNKCLPGRAPGV
jgi:hypothetical protein